MLVIVIVMYCSIYAFIVLTIKVVVELHSCTKYLCLQCNKKRLNVHNGMSIQSSSYPSLPHKSLQRSGLIADISGMQAFYGPFIRF